MTAMRQTTYTVEAYNLSHATENKIHDDTVARKLGFTGGLVPGVEVYAYATHPVVTKYGRAWLERGRMEARFLTPLYDGRMATVTAVETGAGLDLKLESDGVLCATGNASLGDAGMTPPAVETYAKRLPPAEAKRPPADEASLSPGTVLGTQPFVLTRERSEAYLADVRERHELYAREGLAHPGLLLRLCNLALRENVLLSPWVHTGSKVWNFAAAHIGDALSARGRVVQNYAKKGHRLVDLDIILVANDNKVLAQVLHTAIYKLRHLAENG